MIDRLFVYGTLKSRSLMESIIGYDPHSLFNYIALYNYELYQMGLYAIRPCPGDITFGVVWNLENPEIDIEKLDMYECVASGLYTRERIFVGAGLTCWIYMPGEKVLEKVFGK